MQMNYLNYADNRRIFKDLGVNFEHQARTCSIMLDLPNNDAVGDTKIGCTKLTPNCIRNYRNDEGMKQHREIGTNYFPTIAKRNLNYGNN